MRKKYPTRVMDCEYGKCLIADRDLPAGTVVEKFEGPVGCWDDVPECEVCYALLIDNEHHWLVPTSDARYINHSCDPNSIIDDDLQVVTIRPVKAGEEISFSYNVVREGEDPGEWDPRWSFDCACGAKNCKKRIDGYIRLR